MKPAPVLLLWLVSLALQAQPDLPEWAKARMQKISDKYVAANYLSPQFLAADFSGDQKTDIAIQVERKSDKKKGILFLFAESETLFLIGAGTVLAKNVGDDLYWPATWNVVGPGITYETTFFENGDIDGAKDVRLKWAAVSIREEEGSGGLVYYDGTKFIWIHQGD